jgi:putative tryptophan/tyrosine transport system substrate-binding protein
MRRRDFIAGAGSTAVWPLTTRAQERVPRIGVLVNAHRGHVEAQARLDAFLQGLQELGRTDGRNLRIDIRWGGPAAEVENHRKYAAELAALAPDVILTTTGPSTAATQRATKTIPIVFAMVLDPVGSDIVDSLARPGGHTTGFMQFEFSLAGKWLELLRPIAPSVTRAAVVRNPTNAAGIGQFAVIQAIAPSLNVEVTPIGVRDAREIEQRVSSFARIGNGGLIATGGQATAHQDLIRRLAVQHRLPVVYAYSYYVEGGGLISYGPDVRALFRQAASYVDRILKGEKPADLAVQAPTKYEMVVNLKAAKLIGLEVPPSVLVRADTVIE